MCTSKNATGGCLAKILRRIVYSYSLPIYPFDHLTEANSSLAIYTKKLEFTIMDKLASKVTPGIVARLMRLDFLLDISLLKRQVNPNSITRSRLMNSVDYKQQDIDHSIQGKHRRVKSTLSFRDMLTYLELENKEFFVLSFEKGSEKKELRSIGRKCKGGDGELKQRKKKNEEDDQEHANSKRVLNVLNEEKLNRRIVDKPKEEVAKCNDFFLEKPIMIIKGQECSKCVDKKAMLDGAKLRKKRKKIKHHIAKNVEPVCSSEDSSLVSVLDFDQFIIDHDVLTSGLEIPRSAFLGS
ncbi:hypothetical protein REPUB_Repub17cG0042900 [Reevesia pubescens]